MAAFAAMAAVGLLGAALPLSAQDANADLRKEVDELRAEIRELRKEAPASTPVSVDPVAEPRLTLDGESPLLTALKESKLSGFVDASFTFNLNNPEPDGNPFRAFDHESNGFLLNNAQLMLERVATKDFIAGYRIRISMGSDAEIIDFATSAPDEFSIEEGYVQILANVGNGIDIKVGRFVTLAGYEVIESKDNYNFSRSNMFLLAIPFTHTGIRGSYAFSDQVAVTLGVNNGWDVVENDDGQLGLEFQLKVVPVSNITVLANLYWSAEQSAGAGFTTTSDDKRFLFDLVAIATFDKLTIGLNIDFAQEDFEDNAGDVPTGEDSDSWFGWAVYGKYAFNDQWGVALRVDGFNDDEGTRSGTPDVGLLSVTATLEHKPISSLILRFEVRLDTADEDVFLDGTDADDSQTTLAWEAIFIF